MGSKEKNTVPFNGTPEQEKALRETIMKVKMASLDKALRELPPTDMEGFQRIMNEKKKFQDPQKLHISIE